MVYNTNLELLQFLRLAFGKIGYKPLGPYLDKHKGTLTSKYKIERRRDYWKVAIVKFEQSQSLLGRLPLRHHEKVGKKRIALSISPGESWQKVEPRVRELRASIKGERNDFVRLAEVVFVGNHTVAS